MIELALIGDSEAAETFRRVVGRMANASFVEADEMLSHAADAVVILAPLESRPAHIKEAARHGRHILVAAPLAATVEEADAAIAACDQAGVCLMPCHTARFWPSHQALWQSLADGKLGAPGLLRIHRWQPPEKEAPIEKLAREIDLALWLFSAMPTCVYAVAAGRRSARAAQVDNVQLHLGFAEGGMALVDFTAALPEGDDYYSLSLIGSAGAAYADDHRDRQLIYDGGSPRAVKDRAADRAALAELGEFVAAIQAQRSPAVTGTDVRRAVLVADAALRSLESCQAAQLKGDRYELV